MSASKEELQALLERVEKATGRDRNLDAMIHHWALDGVGTGYAADCPNYSGSVDCALALVERVLPGAWYFMSKGRITVLEPLFACYLIAEGDSESEHPLGEGEAITQPLAILAALLRALIAQADEVAK